MSHVDSGGIFVALTLTFSDASKPVRPAGQHGSIGAGGGVVSWHRTDSNETAKRDSGRSSFIIVA
jgi:hypothetical protein